MIDGSEKRNRQLAFELQNSHVCEKRSNKRFQRHCWKSVSQWIDNNDAFLQLKISIRKKHYV